MVTDSHRHPVEEERSLSLVTAEAAAAKTPGGHSPRFYGEQVAEVEFKPSKTGLVPKSCARGRGGRVSSLKKLWFFSFLKVVAKY